MAILDGVLLAGSVLPTVKKIARRHHVCPSTAHRAIAVLVREQLVVVSRGRRAIVSDTLDSSQGGSVGSNPVGATTSDQAVSFGRRPGLLCVAWIRGIAVTLNWLESPFPMMLNAALLLGLI